jgi:hypothetical protein
MTTALMKLLEEKGLTHLLGEIMAAEMIDAIDNPKTARTLAEFANSPAAATLRKGKQDHKRTKKPTISV